MGAGKFIYIYIHSFYMQGDAKRGKQIFHFHVQPNALAMGSRLWKGERIGLEKREAEL